MVGAGGRGEVIGGINTLLVIVDVHMRHPGQEIGNPRLGLLLRHPGPIPVEVEVIMIRPSPRPRLSMFGRIRMHVGRSAGDRLKPGNIPGPSIRIDHRVNENDGRLKHRGHRLLIGG